MGTDSNYRLLTVKRLWTVLKRVKENILETLSLHICADCQLEPLLLVYTKYGCRWRLRLRSKLLALLIMSVWAFIRGF